MTKPIAVGETYNIKISGLSHQGAGVGRVDNFAIFVDQAVPGEEIQVKITEVKKTFAKGKLVKIVTPGEDRIEPACAWFATCGGCQLQHINYQRQLLLKQQMVEEAMKKNGSIEEITVHPTIGMDNPWRYRNKGVFQVGKDGGRIRLGFYEQGSYDFVPAKESMLFSTKVNKLVELLEEQLTLHKAVPYNRGTGEGHLRNVMVRESKATGDIMVVFITADEKWHWNKLVDVITTKFPEVVSVYQNVNKTKSPYILGKTSRLVKGRELIQDAIGEFTFNISPQSFFQVNNLQAGILYEKALEYAKLTGEETVIDAYGGIGTIATFMAKKAKKVYGIEIVEDAIKDAQENARVNNVKNTEFILGKVEEWLPQWVEQGGKIDVIVVDPPRKGCAPETLESIVGVKPERVVYVSCNPATLARDLKFLVAHGYKVKEAQPVDMFPQTAHVECVVLMSRADK